GNITVNANELMIESGGSFNATTFGSGDAGNITVSANGLVIKSGGSFRADTTAAGNAGTITIGSEEAPLHSLSLIDGGFINAMSSTPADAKVIASGRAGHLTIDADSIVLSGREPDLIGPDGEVKFRGYGSRILALAEDSTGKAGEIDL